MGRNKCYGKAEIINNKFITIHFCGPANCEARRIHRHVLKQNTDGMNRTIQTESSRLFEIYKVSYDYYFKVSLVNNNDENTSQHRRVMPTASLSASLISSLYFEYTVKYEHGFAVQDEKYAFALAVIDNFHNLTAIASIKQIVGSDIPDVDIANNNEEYIEKLKKHRLNRMYEFLKDFPHQTKLSCFDDDESKSYFLLRFEINDHLNEKNMGNPAHDSVLNSIIEKIQN